jgi:DNA modification methylase
VSKVVTIGNHATLYLSDCREILTDLRQVDALITDPPYGVSLGSHLAAKDRRADRVLVKDGYDGYDDSAENYLTVVVPAIKKALEITKDGRGLVFGVPPAIWQLPAPTAIGGVYLPAACGRNTWGFQSFAHALLYGRAPNLNLGARHTGIESTDVADKNGHPCPKPLSWMMWAIALTTTPNELALDPFMGSGMTGVAAIKQGRQFVGIEVNPRYFDIACRLIDDAAKEPDMFIEPPRSPIQINMLRQPPLR